MRLVWFQADIARARNAFIARGGMDVQLFDKQVREIQEAGFPTGLGARVIETLPAMGDQKDLGIITTEVFD